MFPKFADKNFLEDIYYKKEYFTNKAIQNTSCEKKEYVELQNHQKLIKNYINPNTPYKNLLVMWGTGVGKTLGAISIAENFKDYIRQIRENTSEKPEIIIISKDEARNNFYNELFSQFIDPPYITPQEKQKLESLKAAAINKNGEVRYREYEKELINRVKKMGYYRFMGSTKFVNSVLGITIKDNKEKERKKTQKLLKHNNNGLIIVDEAHSMDDNDMIKAMQAIKKQSTNLKVILLTATPMINKAREIISMLNILTDKNIKNTDVFESSEYDDLKPNGLKIIAEASRGIVSYMDAHNPFTFPKKIEVGQILKKFDYTRLIAIEMSKFQAKTYDHYINVKQVSISNIGGARGIVDMVLPDPNNKDFGIFERSKIDQLMETAPRDWLNDHNIIIKRTRKTNEPYLAGKFLQMPQLKKYSTKFAKMFDDIVATFNQNNGLGLVYNDQITGIGLKLFGQMLIENGIEKYDINKTPDANKENYNPNAICVFCGKTYNNHTRSHKFTPAKFIYLYGEIEPQDRNKRISLVNSMENNHGGIIKLVLGSRITAESIDFKRLRNIFITNFQDNISTINQIIGRAIRHCSHIGLPDDERNVKIYKYACLGTIEIERYLINERKHENIVKIEDVLKANAIDCALNQKRCYWMPQKDKKNVSKRTFDQYFYEDEIKYNERQIMQLFRKDIAWTYDELKKEILSKSSLTDEKYLAIALDRMINDKKVVMNYQNNIGYIIYDNGQYLFQPYDNPDTKLSLLERFIPIRQIIPQKISINNYLESINKKNKFDFNDIIRKIKNTDDPFIYGRIIGDLELKNQQKILEYGIETNNRRILRYFREFLLTNKQLVDNSFSSTVDGNPNDYVGHVLADKPKCLNEGIWGYCVKDESRKLINKDVKENNIIVGFMDKGGKNMLFKLRPAQRKAKLDRRTIRKGFVCSQSSNKNEIIRIAKLLNINIDNTSIKVLCDMIEKELRKRESRDKGRVKWFYEFIELI